MSYCDFSSNVQHWHDKGFTINWGYSDIKFVLVHFKNGQKKRWYKRTERPYRFKRWFFRKSEDSFSNIANYNSPEIPLYLFPMYISFPKKVFIPMNVKVLRVREPEAIMAHPLANIFKVNLKNNLGTPKIIQPCLSKTSTSMEVKNLLGRRENSYGHLLGLSIQEFKKTNNHT